MHSFSIDNITGDTTDYSRQYGDTRQYYPTYPVYPPGPPSHELPAKTEHPDATYSRTASWQCPVKQEYSDSRTPSPSDSGIDISYSSKHSDASIDDVSKTLAKLSKKSEALVTPETSHEKPEHSFIALISMAIQSSRDRKLVLGDIYQYVMDNFPYYTNGEKAWRNNIRYTLSINDCFRKDGRSDCGKANYWAINPAVADDFARGDYSRRLTTRRKSRSKVKSSSGELTTQNLNDHVTMQSESLGYHPYYTGPRYQATSAFDIATYGHLQTTSPSVPATSDYSPNGGYSEYYQNYQIQQTPSTARDFFRQPSTTSYDTMTSQANIYGYTNSSGQRLPVNVTCPASGTW